MTRSDGSGQNETLSMTLSPNIIITLMRLQCSACRHVCNLMKMNEDVLSAERGDSGDEGHILGVRGGKSHDEMKTRCWKHDQVKLNLLWFTRAIQRPSAQLIEDQMCLY